MRAAMTTAADLRQLHDVRELARQIAALNSRLTSLERTPQLSRSSIDSGRLAIVDDGGIVCLAENGSSRAEMTPLGFLVYDDDGDPTIQLVQGADDFLALTRDDVTVASISSDGVGSFKGLTVSDEIEWQGTNLTDTLKAYGLGHVAHSWGAANRGPYPTETGLIELQFTAEEGRLYRLVGNALFEADAAGATMDFQIRDGGSARPTVNSPLLGRGITGTTPTAGTDVHGYVETTVWCAADPPATGVQSITPGDHRILWTARLHHKASATEWSMVTYPERLSEFYVEDMGPISEEDGDYNTGDPADPDPPDPSPTTKTATWTANASKCYQGGGDAIKSGELRQGFYDSTNGNQRGVIGFNQSAIQNTLAGAVIKKVEVYLHAFWWYFNDGGTAVIGVHNDGSTNGLPDHWQNVNGKNPDVKRSGDWPKPGGRWVALPNWVGEHFRDGTAKGLLTGPGPSNSRTYYGKFGGHDDSNPPRLRIKYRK